MLKQLLILALAERGLKQLAVARFFRRPPPAPPAGDLPLVSVVQPILSGDPTLAESLEAGLLARTGYPREFLWLVDEGDAEARRVCAELIGRHPGAAVRLLLLPPPAADQNPKLAKLIVGARAARGEILLVLDDDTRLPDGGLEQLLPALEAPGVGLAFGLPYYVSFDNLWSALVACFVNSQSLLAYVPYAMLSEPLTINGMCYAVRRATLESVGGFAGLERMVSDDFAVAQRVRAHGYRLAQTPLRHAISTSVAGPGRYWRLMQRWLIFPRESLMRHLPPRELALFYAITLAPLFAPWLAVAGVATGRARALGWAYLLYSNGLAARLDAAYLGGATPRAWLWLLPVVQLMLPLQALAALVAPRRIVWRGRRITINRGGTIG